MRFRITRSRGITAIAHARAMTIRVMTTKSKKSGLTMSLESWKTFFEVGGVVLLFVTFVFGGGAVLTGRWVNEKLNAQLRLFEKDLKDKDLAIAQADERTAALQLALAKQGPRAALLYSKHDELLDRLKPFAPQTVEIRYCRVSFNQYSEDNEAMHLAMLLHGILRQANWSVNPLAVSNCGGTGFSVEVPSGASMSTQKAAKELLTALLSVPLVGIDGVRTTDVSRTPQLPTFLASGEEVKFPPMNSSTIVLTVLTHP